MPYVDVTRWTSRVHRAAALVSLGAPGAASAPAPAPAPVLLSSGWMGGVVPLVAAALAERLGGADRVETAIRYDLADRSGADSVEFMDRLGVDFEVREEGRTVSVTPSAARAPRPSGSTAPRWPGSTRPNSSPCR